MQCPPSERMVFEKELKKNKYVDNSLYTDGCQKGAAWVKVISEIKLHNFRNDKVQHGKENNHSEKEIELPLTLLSFLLGHTSWQSLCIQARKYYLEINKYSYYIFRL